MTKALLQFFNEFKFARKRLGGKWYYVSVLDVSGWATSATYWTQKAPDGDEVEVLKVENYYPNKTIDPPGHTAGHTGRKTESNNK